MLVTVSGYSQQEAFAWLIGIWKLENKPVFEVWSVASDGVTFSGGSFRLEGADTTFTEVISLAFYDGKFHYIPDITGPQPPVDFTITSYDGQTFVAENPHHDFPKKIIYHHVVKDSKDFMEASIEGDGRVITYSFKKVK